MSLGRTKHLTPYQFPVVAAPPTAPSLQRRSPPTTGAGGSQTYLEETPNTWSLQLSCPRCL
jgi:hypothetical protein